MISIEINKENIEIDGNTQLQITQKSPFFSLDFEGSHVFNFTTQFTDPIRRATGFANRPGVSAVKKMDANIAYKNQRIHSGDAFVKMISDKKAELFVGLNESSFYNVAKDTLLEDLPYAEMEIPENQLWNYALDDRGYPNMPFGLFPVFCRKVPESFKIMTPYQDDFFIQNNYPDNYMVTPFYYVCYFIDEIFKYFGYSIIKNEFFEDTKLRKLVVYTPNVTYHESTYHFAANAYCPDISCSDFLKYIFNYFGFKIYINNQNKTVRIISVNSVLHTTKHVDIPNILSLKSEVLDNRGLAFRMQSNSCSYWKMFMKEWQPEDINAVVQYYTDLPPASNTLHLYQVYLVWESNSLRQLVFEDPNGLPDTDPNYSPIYFWKIIGYYWRSATGDQSPTQTITANVSTLFKTTENNESWTHRVIPRYDGDLNLIRLNKYVKFTEISRNDFNLTVLFNWGLNGHDLDSRIYPLGSYNLWGQEMCPFTDDTNGGSAPAPDQIPGADYSLRWEHDRRATVGVYYNFWAKYHQWYKLANRKYTAVARMSFADIINFDFTAKYQIQNDVYLVSELRYDLSNNGMSVVELDMYKV